MKAFDHEVATQKIFKAMESLTKDEQSSVLRELLNEDGSYKGLTAEKRMQLANIIAEKGGQIVATTSEDAVITDSVLSRNRKGYISANAASLMTTAHRITEARADMSAIEKRMKELEAECAEKGLELHAVIDKLHSEGYTDDDIAKATARLVSAAHDLAPSDPKLPGLTSHAAIPFNVQDFTTDAARPEYLQPLIDDRDVKLPKHRSVAVVQGREGTRESMLKGLERKGVIEPSPDPDDPSLSPGESFTARATKDNRLEQVLIDVEDMLGEARLNALPTAQARAIAAKALMEFIDELGREYGATPAQVQYMKTCWTPNLKGKAAFSKEYVLQQVAWAKAEEFIPNIRDYMAEFERRISKCVWPPNMNSPSNVEALCMAMGFCWSCFTIPEGSTEEQRKLREQEDNQKLLSSLIEQLSLTNDKFDLFIRKSRFVYEHPELSTFALAWASSNFAKLEVGHKLAASLALTDIPDDVEVQAPWMAWSFVIPPGLFDKIASKKDGSGELLDWARAFCYGPDVVWVVYSDGEVIGQIDRKKMVSDEAIPTGKMLDSLVRGACLALSDPEQYKKKKIGSSSSSGNRREGGAPDLSNARYMLTAPVQVDLRDVVKAVQRGDKKGGGGKLTVQFLVRGHWKNQAHGPKMQLRKRIWIQPFWKGDENARVLLRNYVIKEDKGSDAEHREVLGTSKQEGPDPEAPT